MADNHFHPEPTSDDGTVLDALNILVVLGLGVCCIPIMLLLMPNLEQSRRQARIAQAYIDVRRLKADTHDSPQDHHEVRKVDPWGQPYRFVFAEDELVRVVSSGPDEVSPETGFDADDIYSDMPVSPTVPFEKRTCIQLFGAMGAAVSVWLLFSACWLRYLRKNF